MSFETISDALSRQKAYSVYFFDSKKLSVHEKEEITKTFALSLHNEVSEIASAVNFKDHRRQILPVDKNKLLYKSVDAFRYILAVLNLWDIDPQTFSEACEDKDLYLHQRYVQQSGPQDNQPVVIFDVDDVIAEFRVAFFEYLNQKWGIKADINDKQYYSAVELQKNGLDAETAFDTFIKDGGFRALEVNNTALETMKMCRDAGYWIQILTARPAGNLKCFYDTYQWLIKSQIPHDSVAFSPEKYLWLTGQDFYAKKQLICVIDDSPKHAHEFAKHGVRVIVPVKSYNADIEGMPNITRLDLAKIGSQDLFNEIRR